ncbi:transglutaminase-like domain-containing protein [Phaeovulum sp. W22_SRMD_FR3]|uniref:transglutaminase-like domain-containing protein n=1 Tax=Phaeovulum sp. W22_SRMD_FR3 TaxID=3240274 RepID=UPI003F96E463
MLIEITTHLDYGFDGPTDCLVQMEAAHLPEQQVLTAQLLTNAPEQFHRIAPEEGIGERIWTRNAVRLDWFYTARVAVDRPDPEIAARAQVPVHLLPVEVVKYLFASRYCPSDLFQTFVAEQFGTLTGGARVAAMRDWIQRAFRYVPGASTTLTTAMDTFVTREGICRDYAHVLITLCRAAAIPARMVSVYAPGVAPQDFHAVVEVYLEGGWHLTDPTGMARAAEMVVISVGRDAADVAFLTSFGTAHLCQQSVHLRRLDNGA